MIEDWDGDAYAQSVIIEDYIPRIIAALRVVEAVRAFDSMYQHNDREYNYRQGFRDGVEAVQALLEGKDET